MGSKCSSLLFQAMASSVLALIVTCVSEPDRTKANDILQSLLALAHVSSFSLSSSFSLLCVVQNSDETLAVAATKAICSVMCVVRMNVGDMECVLNGGVVERVCGWVEEYRSEAEVVELLGLLESVCVGLKGATASLRAKKGMEWIGGKWSVSSRSQAALNLIENTLLSVCGRKGDGESRWVLGIGRAGGMLAVHFPDGLRGTAKEVGVIGIDIGQAKTEMEERMRQIEEEYKKHEAQRERERSEEKRRADEQFEKYTQRIKECVIKERLDEFRFQDKANLIQKAGHRTIGAAAITIRALIHLGCQPRGAVDDDDEEDEGKHAMKKQFDTTCTIEFIGVPVDESEPQSFNSQCASSIERGADTTERSGIEGEEVLACTVVVFVGEIPWIAKQLSGDVDEKEMRGELEEVVPIHSPPKRAALLRSSICSSSSLHSERVVR
ncbi:hypothetical protein BLNAU_18590 [Blattamonas nauphoetae]|uniref:Uncharacterized protein n=2 Tax=Blattamonas nauphoetae TaxID=2049346 RepID=A0ABQ9X475_9EUKA|nr:hypothetical protein BLNAU_18590 [Blattamonas nauphoetae]